MINKKSYYVSKSDKSKEVVYLELDQLEGYQVTPKARKKNDIEVNKIVFVNKEIDLLSRSNRKLLKERMKEI